MKNVKQKGLVAQQTRSVHLPPQSTLVTNKKETSA